MMAADPAAPSFPAGPNRRVTITAPSVETAIGAVAARLAQGRGFALATLNLDHLVKLRASPAFAAAYAAHDIVTADGRPIVWLSRLAGRRASLAAGSDMVGPLCAAAARVGAPLALFGSTQDVLDAAAAHLCAAHPGLTVALTLAPPQGFDPEGPAADACAAQIAASGARLCLVALGAPKQELFAIRARQAAPACGFAAVGAGVDFVAGAQRRAPRWVRRMALEWLWRMLSNPRRLTGRYVACALLLPSLMLDALRQRRVPTAAATR